MSSFENIDIKEDLTKLPYNYQNTIPKSCVHRAVVGEVFLTDVRKKNDDEYVAAGYLPKSHIYFNDLIQKNPDERTYDSILLLEICRQTSIHVTHNFFSVPYSSKFIFDDAEFTLLTPDVKYKVDSSHVLVNVEVIEKKYRRETITGLLFKMDIEVDGIHCAQKFMSISWMDEKKWYRLRNSRPPARIQKTDISRISADIAGRQLWQNIVIGDIEYLQSQLNATVIVDQSHPSIFDHPLDHVPGMLLIEACRQTALLVIHKQMNKKSHELIITKYSINFSRFCELNASPECKVDYDKILISPEGRDIIVPIEISQSGNVVSSAELSLLVK